MIDCIDGDGYAELSNPGEEDYRTAHLQKKDGSYADVVMPADIFMKNKSESVPKGGAIC